MQAPKFLSANNPSETDGKRNPTGSDPRCSSLFFRQDLQDYLDLLSFFSSRPPARRGLHPGGKKGKKNEPIGVRS